MIFNSYLRKPLKLLILSLKTPMVPPQWGIRVANITTIVYYWCYHINNLRKHYISQITLIFSHFTIKTLFFLALWIRNIHCASLWRDPEVSLAQKGFPALGTAFCHAAQQRKWSMTIKPQPRQVDNLWHIKKCSWNSFKIYSLIIKTQFKAHVREAETGPWKVLSVQQNLLQDWRNKP